MPALLCSGSVAPNQIKATHANLQSAYICIGADPRDAVEQQRKHIEPDTNHDHYVTGK
ncbi:hypothetical protein FSO04_44430 [Paraburkholderia madseniana]|jgi:hypothetical protein|uniref:Uncharacterized protein n=1 Tax=Paraburkholderia madseniana TaxID=2599607 RepID=A0A6N6W1Y9_9BURK|nr:hypothetical protein [Paraburkholderia madseniana]KAE8753570.1 hypothetical protein FSO04_44430 [Paraburkholderia madseniana]